MTENFFRRIKVPRTGQSVLQCAVFGLWEDLCGPCVKCRFGTSLESSLSMEEAHCLVKIALSYHLKDSTNYNHFNVCEFGDLDKSGFNCVYRAPLRKGQTTFCILGIFPGAFYHSLKTFTSLLSTFWSDKMDALRMYHFISDKTLMNVTEHIEKYLADLCDLLSQLENSIRSPFASLQQSPINLKDTFVQRCVASHLITFGRSLVLGKSVPAINGMIHVLILFSLPHRRMLCVPLSTESPERQFHAELFVQGVLLIDDDDDDDQYPVTVWDILKAAYPITIINVETKQVQCSVSLLAHQKRRKVFLATALSRYLKDRKCDGDVFQAVEEVTVDDLLVDGHVISKEVESVCLEMMGLNGTSNQLIAGVDLFMRQMLVKAKTIISYTKAWEDKGDAAGLISKRSLWSISGIASDGDYLIVQALGEQLHPGLINTLDRRTDTHM